MRLLIIRHADPDYSIDSLTEQGRVEAKLLSERLVKEDIKAFYVSPLGRAKDTANYTLEKLQKTAAVCDWLREFPPLINKPNEKKEIVWDWLPQDWTKIPEFYDRDKWTEHEELKKGNVLTAYKYVCDGLDKLLKDHGYVREGNYYRVEKPNNDTIALFCHFGLECVLLSHLIGVSPMPLWHGTCAAPSSVTTVYTEERREGIASFRVCGFGDISHLYVAGEKPSFSGRFCELYTNIDERHD